jgi:hypothetical protein
VRIEAEHPISSNSLAWAPNGRKRQKRSQSAAADVMSRMKMQLLWWISRLRREQKEVQHTPTNMKEQKSLMDEKRRCSWRTRPPGNGEWVT